MNDWHSLIQHPDASAYVAASYALLGISFLILAIATLLRWRRLKKKQAKIAQWT